MRQRVQATVALGIKILLCVVRRKFPRVAVVGEISPPIGQSTKVHKPLTLRADPIESQSLGASWVGRERQQFPFSVAVVVCLSLFQRKLVPDLFVFFHIYHLPHSQIGVEPLRMSLGEGYPEHGAPRVSQQENLSLAILLLQITDDFFPIAGYLLDRD